jgi:3-oxoacyl-(acyl-carrier-protein) synthase
MINKIISNSSRRVVITGMGMVSPLGISVQQNWENLIKGKVAIRDLSKENFADSLPKSCRIGATLDDSFDKNKFKTLVSP